MNYRFLLPAIALLLMPPAPGRAALTEAEVQRTLAPRFQAGLLQAVSVGVVQPGGTLLVHGGTLAPDLSAAPSDRTLYEIGSITKVFTGLLLADAVVALPGVSTNPSGRGSLFGKPVVSFGSAMYGPGDPPKTSIA